MSLSNLTDAQVLAAAHGIAGALRAASVNQFERVGVPTNVLGTSEEPRVQAAGEAAAHADKLAKLAATGDLGTLRTVLGIFGSVLGVLKIV